MKIQVKERKFWMDQIPTQQVIRGLSPLVNISIQTRTILERKRERRLCEVSGVSATPQTVGFFSVFLPREANERTSGKQ